MIGKNWQIIGKGYGTEGPDRDLLEPLLKTMTGGLQADITRALHQENTE